MLLVTGLRALGSCRRLRRLRKCLRFACRWSEEYLPFADAEAARPWLEARRHIAGRRPKIAIVEEAFCLGTSLPPIADCYHEFKLMLSFNVSHSQVAGIMKIFPARREPKNKKDCCVASFLSAAHVNHVKAKTRSDDVELSPADRWRRNFFEEYEALTVVCCQAHSAFACFAAYMMLHLSSGCAALCTNILSLCLYAYIHCFGVRTWSRSPGLRQ